MNYCIDFQILLFRTEDSKPGAFTGRTQAHLSFVPCVGMRIRDFRVVGVEYEWANKFTVHLASIEDPSEASHPKNRFESMDAMIEYVVSRNFLDGEYSPWKFTDNWKGK